MCFFFRMDLRSDRMKAYWSITSQIFISSDRFENFPNPRRNKYWYVHRSILQFKDEDHQNYVRIHLNFYKKKNNPDRNPMNSHK